MTMNVILELCDTFPVLWRMVAGGRWNLTHVDPEDPDLKIYLRYYG